jgi:hypothetical protein
MRPFSIEQGNPIRVDPTWSSSSCYRSLGRRGCRCGRSGVGLLLLSTHRLLHDGLDSLLSGVRLFTFRLPLSSFPDLFFRHREELCVCVSREDTLTSYDKDVGLNEDFQSIITGTGTWCPVCYLVPLNP